jgi:hypothetical protein
MIEGEVDVVFSFLNLHVYRNQIFSSTYPHLNDKVIIVIPKNIAVDPISKLLMPFQFYVWLAILSCALLGVFTILALNRLKKFEPVFGKVNSPIFNLLLIIFGMSLTNVSRRNSSRILTMAFVLSCLILRSAYSGEVFRIMHSNPTKLISSINDLVRNEVQLCAKEEMSHVATSFFK